MYVWTYHSTIALRIEVKLLPYPDCLLSYVEVILAISTTYIHKYIHA